MQRKVELLSVCGGDGDDSCDGDDDGSGGDGSDDDGDDDGDDDNHGNDKLIIIVIITLFPLHASFRSSSGFWSSIGSSVVQSNDTHTVCAYNHMSTFVLLSEVHPEVRNTWINKR